MCVCDIDWLKLRSVSDRMSLSYTTERANALHRHAATGAQNRKTKHDTARTNTQLHSGTFKHLCLSVCLHLIYEHM